MAITKNNKPYENYVLTNEIEDQFTTHLDHAQFCTINNNLVGTPGMVHTFRKYFAKVTKTLASPSSSAKGWDSTAGNDGIATEKLNLKAGNTKFIEMDYGDESYTIQTAQNIGVWYDEEQMKDPYVGLVIARHAGTDMFNTMQKDVLGEFARTTQEINLITDESGKYFDAFVDAQALLGNFESLTDAADASFALVNKKSVAALRKSLKDDLKYVEAFVRTGYIGTVAGTNIYQSLIVPETELYIATRKAVTLFNKTGTQTELYQLGNRSQADANVRKNSLISRKYYVAALTDESQAVKISLVSGNNNG